VNEQFSFEHQWQMSEEEYQLLVVQLGRHARRMHPLALTARVGLWAALGTGLLFVPYLSAFGVLVLLVVVVVLLRKPIWRWMLRVNGDSQRAHTLYLHEPVLSGVSEAGFWIESSTVKQHTAWPALFLWEVRDGWLRLAPAAGPQAYFPVAAMQAAGVFDFVMAKARAHGGEYDTPSALRRQRELKRAAV
jgi:hypothetical protein